MRHKKCAHVELCSEILFLITHTCSRRREGWRKAKKIEREREGNLNRYANERKNIPFTFSLSQLFSHYRSAWADAVTRDSTTTPHAMPKRFSMSRRPFPFTITFNTACGGMELLFMGSLILARAAAPERKKLDFTTMDEGVNESFLWTMTFF